MASAWPAGRLRFAAYRRELERFVFRSGSLMRPVFEAAARDPNASCFAEGEDERMLRAAQTLVDDGTAQPILLGRHDIIAAKVKEMGLRMDLGGKVRVLDPEKDGDCVPAFGPGIPATGGTQRHAAGVGGEAGRQPAVGGRRDAAARRAGRRGDLWRNRRLVAANPVYSADNPAPGRCQPDLRACPA